MNHPTPGAHVATDERAAFEQGEQGADLAREWGFGANPDHYANPYVQNRWAGFQRRANLAGAPAEPPKQRFSYYLESDPVLRRPAGHYVRLEEPELFQMHHAIGDAPVQPAQQDDLHFNAQRLRNVATLVGLEGAIPNNDAALDGARGAVLGMIAGRLRGEAQIDQFAATGAGDTEREPDDAGEESAEDGWRRLALQFDNHRMQALWHLKAMVLDAQKHTPVAAEFLSAPPLSGEEVLAQRIAAMQALAPTQQPSEPK